MITKRRLTAVIVLLAHVLLLLTVSAHLARADSPNLIQMEAVSPPNETDELSLARNPLSVIR